MSNTLRRRPSELTGSVSDEGVFSRTAPSAAQLIPSELPRAACPVNPRPRNLRVYQAACAAAVGEAVTELDAQQITPCMRAWSGGHFLTVIEARHMRLGDIKEFELFGETTRSHEFMVLRLGGDGITTGWLVGELDTPVYVLA